MESNSETMKDLVVETFYQEEIAPMLFEKEELEEWKSINQELGMTGQTALHSEPDSDPIPFMHLKTKHKRILDTLCPAAVTFKAFSITPIPLPIMKAIKHAYDEKMFTEIRVMWDDKSPDPAVVGIKKMWGEWNNYSWPTKEEAEAGLGKKIGNYNYDATYYLIGKWGDVALDWASLETKAIARWMKEQRTSIEESIKDYQRKLDDIIINAEKHFA